MGTIEEIYSTDQRRSLSDMTDRELMEEMAQNMRDVSDMVGSISAAIQKEGIVGLIKGMMKG